MPSPAHVARRRVWAMCLALPEVIERPSHGAPTFFWLGVRLDRDPDWDEVAEIVTDAYRAVAPKKLVALLDEA